ncbi:hypothetical protein SEA_LEOPARD_11 [Mycobacterium phage Leopard]|uniref:Uncharacterized protein n=1 Tax=Mycobacterium phage Onyinye TaxID=2686235 RepID=A0A6B9LCZ2_9CAUD|nr:hypothetical protein PP339_gp011 [Mycobacterium phage Onyinye]QHB37418.1 hypothetical protein SEA_ONYINYE_11 [Mycobacterium phage Onyinye]UOW92889.1 hypothetical protein SEA_LEOPARD_11 [Mycobacterium phage Leopard]WKW85172.1 hypothetical protein SEA_AIKOY__10 [Mycobacterium phage Aikoy]
MARGGRGGRRGGSRGRGVSVAQSGGVANSWSDSKKGSGSTWTNKGGSNDTAIGKSRNARGQVVTTRTPNGDKHKTSGNGGGAKRGAPAALSGNPHPTPSGGAAKFVAPTVRKDIYGRGGSRG